jgi:hypothetical protein
VTGPAALATTWSLLESHGRAFAGNYRVLDLEVRGRMGEVMLAVDSEGRRLFLALLPTGTEVQEDLRSAGVHLTTRVLVNDGVSRTYGILSCHQPRLFGVFASLAEDARARLEDPQSSASEVLGAILEEWRELLLREEQRRLSPEEEAGLFAELWTLRKLCTRIPSVVESWVGPLGARHDFVFASTSLEVKATVSRSGRSARIHGLEQLEPLAARDLFLLFVRLEPVPHGGQSIRDIVDSLSLGGAERELFMTRLSRTNYDHASSSSPSLRRFEVTEERFYGVDEAFPALTRGSLSTGEPPAGVTRIEYAIDLSGSVPAPLASSEVELWADRLVGPESTSR